MGIFMKGELSDLTISFVTISLAFSMFAISFGNYSAIPIIFIAVGTGFIFHELGHRFVAINYGCHAYYKMWTPGLFMALALAIMTGGRFIFAAPGAVYISKAGGLTRKENGIISLAGPATNLVLAVMFAVLFIAFPMASSLKALAAAGFSINVFLGMFNMLPFPPLDGSKVAAWNFKAWGLFIGMMAALYMMGVSGFVQFVGSLL